MAFDTATALIMTRSLSTLLASATDAEITNALLSHAVPRVRLYILAATDPNGNNIFYTVLSDMADISKASAAESLVDSVMAEPSISEGIRRIAAAFACSWLIISKFSVLDSQQKQGEYMEKQALADLDRLTKGHLLHSAISSAAAAAKNTLPIGPALYIATQLDPNTVDTTTNSGTGFSGAQLPYIGATQAGQVSLYVNGVLVTASVAAGDAPITVANNIVQAFNVLPAGLAPNVNLAASEIVTNIDSAYFQDNDPVTGLPFMRNISYVRKMAKIVILPKDYDLTLEVAVASIQLASPIQGTSMPVQYTPGIGGLVYGTDTATVNLTALGPHAIAVELKSGKVTSLSSTIGTSSQPISDTLFFLGACTDAFASQMTYRVNDSTVHTMAVPEGTDACGIAELLAQDLAANAQNLRLLGAVRPSSLITIDSTPIFAPGLELVAFGLENELSKVVFYLLSVPAGITFGVVPNTLATSAVFDNRPKSIVVTTDVAKHAGQGNFSSIDERQGNVIQVTYIPTPGLQNLLDRMNSLKPININYGFPF